MSEQERCPECGRRKAHGGDDWSVSYNSARWDEVADLCGRHLPSYWSDESIPDCKDATLAHQKEQLASLRKALAAAEEMRYELGRWRNHSQADTGPGDACDAFDAAMAEVRKGEG